ncbi:MAG: monooxygenase [Oricola sp.]
MTTALIFHFPYDGPWGKDMTLALGQLALDIAAEDGLVCKVWLEDREAGRAGGIYLFSDAANAERYRAKHEARLAATGHHGIEVIASPVNVALSALTGAGFIVDKPGRGLAAAE